MRASPLLASFLLVASACNESHPPGTPPGDAGPPEPPGFDAGPPVNAPPGTCVPNAFGGTDCNGPRCAYECCVDGVRDTCYVGAGSECGFPRVHICPDGTCVNSPSECLVCPDDDRFEDNDGVLDRAMIDFDRHAELEACTTSDGAADLDVYQIPRPGLINPERFVRVETGADEQLRLIAYDDINEELSSWMVAGPGPFDVQIGSNVYLLGVERVGPPETSCVCATYALEVSDAPI